MGNDLSYINVINQESERLRIRVDCDRYVTSFTIKAHVLVAENGGSKQFAAGNGISYITATTENGKPLFINHPVHGGSTLTIQNGSLHFTKQTMLSAAACVVLIVNKSNYEIYARVDVDQGVCSFSKAMEANGVEVSIAGDTEIYYKAERQGFTCIMPGQFLPFFVKPLNNIVFVTLEYKKPDGNMVEICKNTKTMFRTFKSKNLGKYPYCCDYGPLFVIKNDSKYNVKYNVGRFKITSKQFADAIEYWNERYWNIDCAMNGYPSLM
uniref:Uncharacterized protein n=1 Tax=Panagrolaimus sp. ES5 TaxID=591445 RepID=A0AC34G2P7_9BILA